VTLPATGGLFHTARCHEVAGRPNTAYVYRYSIVWGGLPVLRIQSSRFRGFGGMTAGIDAQDAAYWGILLGESVNLFR